MSRKSRESSLVIDCWKNFRGFTLRFVNSIILLLKMDLKNEACNPLLAGLRGPNSSTDQLEDLNDLLKTPKKMKGPEIL